MGVHGADATLLVEVDRHRPLWEPELDSGEAGRPPVGDVACLGITLDGAAVVVDPAALLDGADDHTGERDAVGLAEGEATGSRANTTAVDPAPTMWATGIPVIRQPTAAMRLAA